MNKAIIDTFLKPYKKVTQFLQSFELIKNKGISTFKVDCGFYFTPQSSHHFTAVELQVCLNQLLYVYFAHLGLYGDNWDCTKDTGFVNMLTKNDYIIEQKTSFKKEIDTSKLIHAEIEVIHTKKIDATKFMECRFQFEDACFGSVLVAHKEQNTNE
jgi:hypothetical protein